MNLTRNERKALKIMLENAKVSDSYIASKLNISSQAVGKIRKKLEQFLIDSYTLKLNYEKLGIRTFAMACAKPTQLGIEKGEKEIEKKLLENPHVIQVFRLQGTEARYMVLYAFRDIEELDNFFHTNQNKEIHSLIENKEIHAFSHASILKNDATKLFYKIIEDSFTNQLNNYREFKQSQTKTY